MLENKVEVINLSGGILGLLLTNPRSALGKNIAAHNAKGWRVVQVIPHSDTNLMVYLLKLVVLMLTLLMWTWGAGYIVIYERIRQASGPATR